MCYKLLDIMWDEIASLSCEKGGCTEGHALSEKRLDLGG